MILGQIHNININKESIFFYKNTVNLNIKDKL